MVPMPSEVDGIIGDDDEVECAWWDSAFATGTDVVLDCLIGLDRVDGYVENSAHAITANVATTTKTTTTMSNADFSC